MKSPNLGKLYRSTWVRIQVLFVLLILVGLLLYSYFEQGIVYSFATSDVSVLSEVINSFGWLKYPLFVVLVILEVVLAPIPPLVLYLAGGILFGGLLGGTLALVGNVLGALIAFGIARTYGRAFIEQKIPQNIILRFDRFFMKYGIFTLFFLRLNPFTSSDIFSYIAGLTAMKWQHVLFGTLLGLIPAIYVQTYFGSNIIAESQLLTQVFIWLSVVYTAVIIAGMIYAYKIRKQ